MFDALNDAIALNVSGWFYDYNLDNKYTSPTATGDCAAAEKVRISVQTVVLHTHTYIYIYYTFVNTPIFSLTPTVHFHFIFR